MQDVFLILYVRIDDITATKQTDINQNSMQVVSYSGNPLQASAI